ncbi:MAG TPA: MopE-related protein [Myxococcota bacterium]|nr:MopE-related protein [Myxococcota bacterium]
MLALSFACRNKDPAIDSSVDDSSPPGVVDADGDGSPEDEDCDDLNNTVKPGNTEIPYNGQDDNDCDGDIDEDDAADAETWFEDGDSDGYGDYSRLYDLTLWVR